MIKYNLYIEYLFIYTHIKSLFIHKLKIFKLLII